MRDNMYTYAIRRKSDGYYMPAHRPSKPGKTYSWDEPEEKGGSLGPRLFPSEQSARNALTAWLQGTWEMSYIDDYYLISIPNGPVPSKQPNRNREDMEIVRFHLIREHNE